MTSRSISALAVVTAIVTVLGWLWLVSSRARIEQVNDKLLARGVSADLASVRARSIHALRYDISLVIPARQTEPVRGRETIRFTLSELPNQLAIDFDPGNPTTEPHMVSVKTGGTNSTFSTVNGHLVVPSSQLRLGENEMAIEFVAGDGSLNRNPEYLYSLFVPARAHLAFPCFDQPDLKGRYTLSLDVPAEWQAVANGAETDRQIVNNRTLVRFAETPPLPTYLFAFAAGKFHVETAARNGRTFRMFHRETDTMKVARNRDTVFNLHAAALNWLEDYTGIPYMFGKFDFVLIPSFQFSGMEHAGAILYNASSLLLDETATQDQQLARANTISHETAHMWFGDFVTMRWFDDVWMKEVFANFFAAKIVNPSFPSLNHTLRFLVAHYPPAYEIDRTAGANPIRQQLDNLNEAGSLYGNIIYDKAPIVMRQLEAVVGEDAFKAGLRDYLHQYAFGNATWPDLIRLLDDRTEDDLEQWSHAWVEEPGRPTIETHLQTAGSRITDLRLTQEDPHKRGLRWNQQLDLVLGYAHSTRSLKVKLAGAATEVVEAQGLPSPIYVLPNGGAFGYGLFELDAPTRDALLTDLPDISDAVARGSAWIMLWDEVLEGRVRPADFLQLALRALPKESDELNVQQMLGYVRAVYWRLISDEPRRQIAPQVEAVLLEGLTRAGATTSLKAAYLSALRNVVMTADTVGFLERLWQRREKVPGLTLAEADESALALDLAVRQIPRANDILREQLGRIQNSDRRDRFTFLMPALSPDRPTRDRFFASLRDVANRRHEPWVVDALAYLNHPIRSNVSEPYLQPSLDLLEEIQRTGDIFFPKRWLDATFYGHSSAKAAATIREFLETHPNYPARLRQIILQSADIVFRAAELAGRSQDRAED